MQNLSTFEKQFQKEFFRQSNGEFRMDYLKYQETKHSGFWTILRGDIPKTGRKNSAWSRYCFHFEILFSAEPLENAEILNIEAHIDLTSEAKDFSETLAEEFQKKGFPPDRSNHGCLCKETRKADFSDFSATIDTINRILEILHSKPFQDCKQIADNFKL